MLSDRYDYTILNGSLKMERKLTREDFMSKSFRKSGPRKLVLQEAEPTVNGAPPPSPVSLAMLESNPQSHRTQYEITTSGIAPKKLEINKAHPIHLKSFQTEPPDDPAPAAPSDDVLRKLERQIGEMERGLERAQNGTVAVDERARYAEHENLTLRTGVSSAGGGQYLAGDSDTEHDVTPFKRNETARSSTGGATPVPRPATRLSRTNSDTQQHQIAATARLMRKFADAGTKEEKTNKVCYMSCESSLSVVSSVRTCFLFSCSHLSP